MTMRLDIVTNDAGELVRREHARELGAGVVVAIYRLAKLAQMHDLGNQAFVRQLEQTHQLIGEYCLRSGSNVSVLFAERATFVAGQLLKGNRGAYEAASELGALLERIGGSELHISRDVTREDLLAFAEQISLFYRTGNAAQLRLPPKIHLRRVADVARLRGIELEDLTPDQRIVRAYASAVVIMRRFFEDLSASRYVMPRRIKRIAQSLVDLSDANTASYLGVTEARNANYDEAGRAVNTAILAVAIARETTQDRTTLAQIAMAAMMHDVARPRALALAGAAGGGMPGMAGPTMLSEDQEDRLPAGAAAVLTALGRVNEPSITRTVLTFEALWLRRRTWLGPVYWGARAPTLHASIIAVARRYNDLLTPEPGLPPPTPDFAVATLANELTDAQDRTVLRMLVSALGLLPTGTVVQLSTGEVAEVIRGARGLGDKPRVAILADASGAQFAQPIEVELAQDPRRTVHRVLSVDGWRKGLAQGPQAGGADDEEAIAVSVPPPDPVAVTERPQSAEGAEAMPPPVSPAGVSPLAPHLSPGPPHQQTAPLPSWDADDGSGSGEQPSSASLPSLGSSPSAVAEAMGRIINNSLAPPAMPPREANQPDRTVFQPMSPDDVPMRRVVSSPVREPTARGNLAATPLPHVLVYMLDHSLTGSVVFEGTRQTPDGVDDTIYFVNGVPAKIRLDQPVALLGQVLVEDGSLDPKVVDQAADGARRLGILFGEYLVGHDMVSRETLAWALEGQMLRKIAQVANLAPEVEYSYYRDVDLLDNWGGDITVTHPLNPILASVRHWTDRQRIRATLNRIGKHPLVLHADSDLSTLAVLPDEQKVLDTIRGQAMTLPQLFNLALCDAEVVSSLIYSLAVTRQFAFKGQKKGPMAARGAAWRSIQPPASSSAPSIPSASGTVAIPASRQAASPAPVAKAAPATATAAAPVPPPPETPRSPAGAPRVGPPSAQMRAVVPPPGAPSPRPLTPAARPQGGGPGKGAPQIRPIAKKTIHGLQPGAPPEGRPPASVRQPAAPPAQGTAPDAPPTSVRSPSPVDDAKTIAVASPIHELMAKHGPAPAPPGAGRPPIKPAGPPGAAAKPPAQPPLPPGAKPAPPGVPPDAKSSASGVKLLGPGAPPGAKSSASSLKAAGASPSGAGAPSASGVKAAAPVPTAPSSSSGKALAPGGAAPAAGAKAPQKPPAPTAGKSPPRQPSPAGLGAAKPAEGGPRATGANPPAKVPMAPATLKGVAPAPSSDDVSEAAESAEAGESAEPEGGSAVEIGEAGLADAEAALEAMTSFRLAEGALQRNDRAAAEEHAKKAVAGDPTQPDYIALLAWIRSLGGEPQLVDEAIRTMSKVLIEDPSNEKALFYRAKLLVKTNRLPEALNDFNELLAANPNHREAQNEARLLKERLPQ
jgi:hypothetical protein